MNLSAAGFEHDGREPSDDDILGCDVSDAALDDTRVTYVGSLDSSERTLLLRGVLRSQYSDDGRAQLDGGIEELSQ